jgi:hypothetical protein
MVACSACAGAGDIGDDQSQIKVERVKPVESTTANFRLSDDRIDLMSGFSLSSAQAIGGAWGIPVRPLTPFDERYGQW